MFWFAFISILLFILFLIVILVTTGRSSTDKTLRSLKDELEEKNRLLDAKKKKSKVKKEPKKRKPKPTVTEVVEAPVVIEEAVAVEDPDVKADVPVQDDIPVSIEVVPDSNPEELIPTLDDETKTEELVTPELITIDAVPEETELVKEELEVTVEPLIEESEVEDDLESKVEPEIPVVEEPILEVEEKTSETVEETLEVPVEPSIEVEVPAKEVSELPYEYTVFDNARTMEEFGLSKEEADEFIVELITQVEDEMPALEAAVEVHDAKQIEDISHMVKGSATNLGIGGIADVLIDFNTYMKSDNDPAVVAGHMNNLRRALKELKEQFQ